MSINKVFETTELNFGAEFNEKKFFLGTQEELIKEIESMGGIFHGNGFVSVPSMDIWGFDLDDLPQKETLADFAREMIFDVVYNDVDNRDYGSLVIEGEVVTHTDYHCKGHHSCCCDCDGCYRYRRVTRFEFADGSSLDKEE